MYPGQKAAAGIPITTPLPLSWISRPDAPLTAPIWASVGIISTVQLSNLLAQIAYDLSGWNYNLIGNSNQLGRYQFSTQLLENYNLLATGSNTAYGTDCVNYRHCWQPTIVNNGINNYANYFYNINNINQFLSTPAAQEHLAYQYIADLYKGCTGNGVILSSDSVDVVTGLLYVAWTLGVGSAPTVGSPEGTGAWAWRYNNIGSGVNSYNSGRYATVVLSR